MSRELQENKKSEFREICFSFFYLTLSEVSLKKSTTKNSFLFILVLRILFLIKNYKNILAGNNFKNNLSHITENKIINTLIFNNENLNPIYNIIISFIEILIIFIILYFFINKYFQLKLSKVFNDPLIYTIKKINIFLLLGGVFFIILSYPYEKQFFLISEKYFFSNFTLVIFIKLFFIFTKLFLIFYTLIISYLGFVEDFYKNNSYNLRNNCYQFFYCLKNIFFAFLIRFNNNYLDYKTIFFFYFILSFYEINKIIENPFFKQNINCFVRKIFLIEFFFFIIYYVNLLLKINHFWSLDFNYGLNFFLILFIYKLSDNLCKYCSKKFFNEDLNQKKFYEIIYLTNYFLKNKNKINQFPKKLKDLIKNKNDFKIYLIGLLKNHIIECLNSNSKCFCKKLSKLSNAVKNEYYKPSQNFLLERTFIQNFCLYLLKKNIIKHYYFNFELELAFLQQLIINVENFVQGINYMQKFNDRKNSNQEHFRIFCLKFLIEKKQKKNEKRILNEDILKLKIDKILNFEKIYKNLKIYSYEYIKHLNDFYQIILKQRVDLNLVEEINSKFVNAKKKYFKNYVKIANCRITQKFHKNFTSNFLYCDIDIKEMKKKKNKKNTEMSLFLKKYDYKSNSCFFVVKSMEKSIGTIKFLNQNVKKITGYTSDYLKNLNLSILLPQTISISHDFFLNNFLKTGIRKLSLTERTVYLMTKNNFLIMPKLSIKNFFDFNSNESLFFALLKKKKKEKNFLLCFQNGKIEGLSENLFNNFKWKNYDVKKDIYVQNLIPDFVKLFFKLYIINHKEKSEQDIIDLVDYIFKDKKIQSNFQSKIYLDPINKEDDLLNFNLENIAKKLKSDNSLLDEEIKNFNLDLKEHLKYSTKKFNFTFKINVFKTKIGFFFTIIFLNISPISITKKALDSEITKKIYEIILIKKIFKKKNFKSIEKKKSTFLIKNKKIENIKDISFDKKKTLVNRKELNLNNNSNNLNHYSFVMNLLEKNYMPPFFKVFKFLTYFTIFFFTIGLFVSHFLWGKTLVKLKKLNQFNFYETQITNDLFRLICFQFQYNRSENQLDLNNNKYYKKVKKTFFDHLDHLKELVDEKDVFKIDKKFQEDILIKLKITDNSDNYSTNIFDGFFILFTEITKDESLHHVSEVTINNLINYSNHYDFFLYRDLVKKFLIEDAFRDKVIVFLLFGVVLILIFIIFFLNWKINDYLNETFELCRLIQKPKNFYYTISNFLSDFKLENYFNLEKKEGIDKGDSEKENIIQMRKKFKKISVNIGSIILKYSIFFFFFILILIVMFILIEYNIKDLQIYSIIKGDIVKNNFIMLTAFAQLMNKKLEIKSNFDFFQDTLNEIVEELYIQNLENYLYDYNPEVCRLNYIKYEECLSIFNGISTKGLLKTISLIKSNLYEMTEDLKNNIEISEDHLIETFKIFIITEIYQELFLDEELHIFNKSYESFEKLLNLITIFTVLFAFFWFLFEKFINLKYIQNRIKKPIYLLKFIEAKKFYSDSKLKIFINKINLS